MALAVPRSTRILEYLPAVVVAISAAVVMTWPLASQASDHVLAAIYYWDAYTNSMIMGSRIDAALGRGPLSLYDNYFHAPLPNTIVLNENHFGLSLIFAPFYLASDNPLLAYNCTLLLSLALSVFFTFLLVRRVTGNAHAGLLAGVGFAFSPYVLFEIGRIQLVATQWIPACFLMLHRAIEVRRLRDVAGLWFCYLLQIGTCLYYAMFLLPLLSLAAAVLCWRLRPPRKLYFALAAGAGLSGLVALAMVHPYFTARDAFFLERSLAFASNYDGKLGFFTNVHETNLTLTGMHHQSETRGAQEEIAFPGFTVLTMLLLALGVPLWRLFQRPSWRAIGIVTIGWFVTIIFSLAVTVLTHSMLAGLGVFAMGVWLHSRYAGPFPFAGRRGMYIGLLLLSITLFMGLSPLQWEGEPVRGLYYYLHTYFPGFNGIRKVSRQAVMTTFAASVLAGFGSAWLFSKLAQPWARAVLLTTLLGATCYELRSFPHPLVSVWAGDAVPSAYRFLALQPQQDRVASLPQNEGVSRFRGDAGMALHNYLALYHKHRSLNGQGSWMPPVTELVLRALHVLPDAGGRRVLQAVGARHLLVHADDLPPQRRNLPRLLASEPEHFRQVFEQGGDTVFSIAAPDDPSLALLDVPALPAGARLIEQSMLRAKTNLDPAALANAIDGNLDTFWSGGRAQAPGQYFELVLLKPRAIVAFEIESPSRVMNVPLSFALGVAAAGSPLRTVAERPQLALYREQVYSPKSFVFRVVLPKPARADRIRITIGQPVPGHDLSIHEARVYAAGPRTGP